MNEPFKLRRRLKRRTFLQRAAAASALALAGCDAISRNESAQRILNSVEPLNEALAKLVGRKALAQEFSEKDISPTFRSNGSDDPGTPQYNAWAGNGFADYRLTVGGLCEVPRAFSLAEVRALPSRTQITRHDCVEGWSAIAKWKGVRLSAILDVVKPAPEARYVMLYCADPMAADGTDLYYESIDFDDARHEQTILAYDLNDAPLPVANGAPLRLRVERQLGYKHAKFLTGLEFVATFANIAGGKGGYWEDQGYQWYAGI
ncbi:MAG: molybdopterin-binding protein [Burkholderiales bacterium]|nr:molybdopterin-binding protein [Burkholderiales bacterium]